jgi:acyl-CoA synthetase (AMP-forming)/AMP-acid ligase II
MVQGTIQSLLERNASEQPDDVWLRDLHSEGATEWTWSQARSEIHAVAAWLCEAIGEMGQRASILSRNRSHWMALSD